MSDDVTIETNTALLTSEAERLIYESLGTGNVGGVIYISGNAED